MNKSGNRLAVTGMSICNALGNDLEEVWAATLAMKSGVGPVEPKFDEPPGFYNSDSCRPGLNSYCDVLAHVRMNISREDLGLPPQDFRVMSASSRLTLLLARRAVAESGLSGAGYEPRRVAVILSQNSGEAASTLWDLNLSLHGEWIVNLAGKTLGLDEKRKSVFREALLKDRLSPDESTMLCRLNSTLAGMISNMHNFAGPSFGVSSACSSGLMALYAAFNLLRSDLIDAAVIGGAEEMYSALWLGEFSAIGALARRVPPYDRPEAMSRPFDAARTGFVFGEGGAVLVVERESSARRRGARIYGLIGGAGCVTNTKGIIEPSAEAQMEATRLSFAGLDYGPQEVDLIECHATATPQGDREEAQAIVQTYSGRGGAHLSAYKSQIGHTVGSSGIMAMIHGLLAMRDRVLPGALNYDNPDPAINLEAHGLRILPRPAPWPEPPSGVRRLQVNCFGFGGSNLIFQVEDFSDRVPEKGPSEVVAVDVPDDVRPSDGFEGSEVVVDGVNLVLTPHQGQTWRLGSVNPSWRMELAGLSAAPSEADFEALARKGLWLRRQETPPPLAVMCCGQGSVWPGMGRALYDALPAARAAMDTIARIAEWDVLGLMDETDMEKITLTRWQQPYLFLVEYAQFAYLKSLGLAPAAMLGHSLGELIALCLSGVYTPKEAWYIIDTRACLMGRMEAESDRGTGMMALHAPADEVSKVLEEYQGLAVSNYNSPTQVILGGPRDLLLEARRNLRKRKIPAIMLPMSLAFHYPGMRVLRQESLESMECVDMRPAALPMLSNVTAGLYPAEHSEIIRYIADLDENPVRWPDCVRAMWNEHGARHFLELGPADVLSGLTGDIIPEALCIPANRKGKEMEGMRMAVARLFALGHLPRRAAQARAGAPQVCSGASASCSGASAPAASPNLSAPTSAAAEGAAAAQSAGQGGDALVEAVMPVIMETTGYKRHELAPDMDLRHDLAIRSSRFPLIMHEAEKRFDISIGFEDLLGVATIRDLAYKIAELRENAPVERALPSQAAASGADAGEKAREEERPVRRYVPEFFRLEGLGLEAEAPPMPLAHIFLHGRAACAEAAAQALARLYGGDKITVLGGDFDPGLFRNKPDRALFLFTDEPEGPGLGDPTAALGRAFALLKSFLADKGARLCCAAGAGYGPERAGVTGMMLAAAMENPSTVFHNVSLAAGAPESWLRAVLGRDGGPAGPVPLFARDGAFYSRRLRPAPIDPGAGGLGVKSGDVVLVSGGAGGIAHGALAGLAEAGCALVALGRSPRPGPEAPIWDLARLGAEVDYISCDITDPEAARAAVDSAAAARGRIDGIFHAAGLLLDATMAGMDAADFEAVAAVKCRGLANLAAAAGPRGLRYALGFSSMAAWFGNYGQANYCAANAAMELMLARLRGQGLAACCIMLPPVAGKGMADGLAEEMKRRGLGDAVIHEEELADFFRLETACGPGGSVLWGRNLPAPPGAPPPAEADSKALAGIVERPDLHPLVFPVKAEGLKEFRGGAHFSPFKHEWLKPGGKAAGTVPPGIALECLLEAAAQLMPWLAPVGARKLRFGPAVTCPPGLTREAVVLCRARPAPAGEEGMRVCDASLEAFDVAANGRRLKSLALACSGEILMAAPGRGPLPPAVKRNADFVENLSREEIAFPGKARYNYPLALFEAMLRRALALSANKMDFSVQYIDTLDFVSISTCDGLRIGLHGVEAASADARGFDAWIAHGDAVVMSASGLEFKME